MFLLEDQINAALDSKLKEFIPLSLGDKGGTFELITAEGEKYFHKWIEHPNALDMMQKECASLQLISETNSCPTPGVIAIVESEGKAGILLEWIERTLLNLDDQDKFGRQLTGLHVKSNATFGYHEDNYISILPQKNDIQSDWASFYASQRIAPLLELAVDQNILTFNDCPTFGQIERRISNEVPVEKPSLIHGDLWSGNYLMSKDHTTYLIDPAIHYGHREMDLAMSLLFGSFGRSFYTAYQEVMPLEKGFQERLHLHQLYPLLVHSILFGGRYVDQTKSILKRI